MTEVYQIRRKEFMHNLASKGISHTLLLDPANVFYYTGFLSEPHERFMALYMNAESDKEILYVPALDQTAAEQASDVQHIIPISDVDNPYKIIKNTAGNLSGYLGIEGNVLQYNQSAQLQAYFSRLQLTDIQPDAHKQRMKKSSEEISAIKTAIKLIEQVLDKGIKKVTPGMTESELTAELEYLMRKVGSDGPSFDTIVLTGKNAALPHGVPGDTKIKQGDMLLIDFGVFKNGYCSDLTRTFAVGDIPDLHKELYDIVLEANQAGIKAIKAGVPLKEFDHAARTVIEKSGYGEYFKTRVGHGMGIEIHEAPSIHGENEQLAVKGMVFTIEPGYTCLKK